MESSEPTGPVIPSPPVEPGDDVHTRAIKRDAWARGVATGVVWCILSQLHTASRRRSFGPEDTITALRNRFGDALVGAELRRQGLGAVADVLGL